MIVTRFVARETHTGEIIAEGLAEVHRRCCRYGHCHSPESVWISTRVVRVSEPGRPADVQAAIAQAVAEMTPDLMTAGTGEWTIHPSGLDVTRLHTRYATLLEGAGDLPF